MSLKALLKEQPLCKISIGEICDLCSMSRKSFYYHFKDKEDLVNWIFDTEFEIASKGEERMIDALIRYFYENKGYYKKVLKEEGQNSFSEHLYSFCCCLMENALKKELEMAELTKRGKSILLDSGTDLIGNTFVLAHDIIYIDKGERNKNAAKGISGFGRFMRDLGEVMTQVTGDYTYYEMGRSLNDMSDVTADVVDDFEGFRVKIQTHLYRLNWQNSDNDFFFENYYLDENYYDESKFHAWKDANYTLTYIGTQEAICGKTVLQGIYDLSKLIQIVVYRTLDESIVKLQKNYEEFRIKEPIYEIDENGYVIAKIGMKEGVGPDSKYEVLERIEDSEGSIKYNRVGTLKPEPNMIWDNRYMAIEDGAENSDLNGTYFRVTSGRDLYPGLLIREIKF